MIRPGPSSVVVHSPTSSFLSPRALPVNQKEEKSKRRKDQNYITKANYIHQRYKKTVEEKRLKKREKMESLTKNLKNSLRLGSSFSSNPDKLRKVKSGM